MSSTEREKIQNTVRQLAVRTKVNSVNVYTCATAALSHISPTSVWTLAQIMSYFFLSMFHPILSPYFYPTKTVGHCAGSTLLCRGSSSWQTPAAETRPCTRKGELQVSSFHPLSLSLYNTCVTCELRSSLSMGQCFTNTLWPWQQRLLWIFEEANINGPALSSYSISAALIFTHEPDKRNNTTQSQIFNIPLLGFQGT